MSDAIEATSPAIEDRATILFDYHLRAIQIRTDRLFAALLAFQWILAIGVAVWISPQAWAGQTSSIHSHVYAAIFLGGGIISLPIGFACLLPGSVWTRHVVAIAQSLMGALLIHLTGGRIETHFHIFGSLALLAFYRDWRVLITASVVVAADHFVRGWLWPYSVFGTITPSPWRWLEHAGWVVFEDLFLIQSCRLGVLEMKAVAWRQAEVEQTRDQIEVTVEQRTHELAERTQHLEVMAEQFRQSEDRFRGAFDAAPIGKAIVSTEGRLLQVNQQLCQFLGYSAEELVTMDFQSLTHPDDLDRDLELMHQMLSGEIQRYEMEKRYVHKQGHILWGQLRASLVRDAAGRPLYFVGQVQDVTDRRRAEKLQTLSIRVTELLVDAEPHDDPLPQVLDLICSMYGWSSGEICRETTESHNIVWAQLGRSESDVIASDELAHASPASPVQELIRAALKQGEPLWNERAPSPSDVSDHAASPGHCVCVAPIISQQIRWGAMSFYAHEPVEQDPALLETLGLIGAQIGQFLKRRQAEQSCRTSERLFRALANQAPIGIQMTDVAGKCVYVNDRWSDLTGIPREQIIGREWSTGMAPEEAARIVREWEAAARRGEPLCSEIGFTRPDGSRTWAAATSAMLVGEDGQPQGYLGCSTDITDRKRAEGELQRAKEAAESANRAKSEFLANMSHEIRTPMNGILGMTELALDTELSPEQREYLETVHISAEGLLTIINDILDFSKIEAGKLSLDHDDFSLQGLLRDTMKAMALRAHQKGLEIAYHIAADVPDALVGDPMRVRQILVNLVGNAIKFTDVGEVVVDIHPESRKGGEVLLHFRVSDTGPGIPDSKQSRIFEAFEQVDGSATRRHGGTGLGLTICARLVQLMGGRIWVESEVGSGSIFHFTAVFPKASSQLPIDSLDAERLAGRRVLVVDDNLTNRRILSEIIESWGMRGTAVDGAAGASETIAQAIQAGDPFELILLDAMMPETDGFMLAEQIKAYDPATMATIMMLSSADRADDAKRCRDLGIAAYLAKPIARNDLYDAVRRVLGASFKQKAQATASMVTSTTQQRRTLNILLAEDNAVNQRLAIRLFEKRGHRVVAVEHGGLAVEALQRQSFDIVFMDVQMPTMDGLEATRRIRLAEGAGRHVPIIAMTAYAMKGDRERCLEAGMDGYVTKPIQTDDLFAALAPHEKHEPAPPAGAAPPQLFALDVGKTVSRFDGDREMVAELAQLFLESSPELIVQLQDGIRNQDLAAVSRAAHTLAGSIGNFAADEAYQLARQVETLARTNIRDGIEEVADRFHDAYERLSQALRELNTSAVS